MAPWWGRSPTSGPERGGGGREGRQLRRAEEDGARARSRRPTTCRISATRPSAPTSTSARAPSPATTTAWPSTRPSSRTARSSAATRSSSRRSRVGKGAYVGAGSSITENVPAGRLGLRARRQSNVDGWATRKAAAPRQEGRARGNPSHVRNHRIHRLQTRRAGAARRAAAHGVSRLRLGGRGARQPRGHQPPPLGRQTGEPRERHPRRAGGRAVRRRATRAGPRTAGRPRRTPIRTGTAPAASSSSTTASSRTTSS